VKTLACPRLTTAVELLRISAYCDNQWTLRLGLLTSDSGELILVTATPGLTMSWSSALSNATATINSLRRPLLPATPNFDALIRILGSGGKGSDIPLASSVASW
jgi:hypothetical protein